MEQLTLWSSGALVSPIQSPDSDRVWMTLEGSSCSDALRRAVTSILSGSYSRTSPDYYPLTEEGVSLPSSMRWQSCGLGGAQLGGFWMQASSDWPKDAGVCSLSSTLETGDELAKHCLSPKACEGILRRVRLKGKSLPEPMEEVLQLVASREMAS